MCSSYQFGTEFMIVEISKQSRQTDYQNRSVGLVNIFSQKIVGVESSALQGQNVNGVWYICTVHA